METTTLLMILGGIGLALLCLGGVLLLRRNVDEAVGHCRCSRCGQKMRFRVSKAQRVGRCPRCGHNEVLREGVSAPSPDAQLVGRPVRGSRNGQMTSRSR